VVAVFGATPLDPVQLESHPRALSRTDQTKDEVPVGVSHVEKRHREIPITHPEKPILAVHPGKRREEVKYPATRSGFSHPLKSNNLGNPRVGEGIPLQLLEGNAVADRHLDGSEEIRGVLADCRRSEDAPRRIGP
jgi:hypothetical protein